MYDDFDERDWTSGFRSRRTWVRGFFMLVFLAVLWFARLLLIVMAVFQFGAQLIAGRPVSRALPLGRGLARYLQQIAMFLTYNSEDKPFPFAPWPDAGVSEADEGEEADGEEGEDYEAHEEPEPEPEPKPKTTRKKKKAAKPADEPAEDTDSPDEDANPDDNEDEPPPPRPDA